MFGWLKRLGGHDPALSVAASWARNAAGERLPVITITNEGGAAVTVTEAGFLLADGRRLVFASGLSGGGTFPKVLAKGASVTVPMVSWADQEPPWEEVRQSYAKTDGDETVTGPPPAG